MNDIVSFKTAVLLKELGFDEPCIATYKDVELYHHSARRYNEHFDKVKTYVPIMNSAMNNAKIPRYSAPHLYEAQKWLRDQYDIHVEVWYNFFHSCWEISLFDLTKAYDRQKRQIVREMIQKNTYEEALESGIQDSLTYLKSIKDAGTISKF